MDYMDVYTPYTLFFSGLITACIILSSLFNAYIIVKARKNLLLSGCLVIQGLLLLWLASKLLELVSPTLQEVNLHITLQKSIHILLGPLLLFFLWSLWHYTKNKKIVLRFSIISVMVFICAGLAYSPYNAVTDLSPVAAFILFNSCFFHYRTKVFAELSAISIDKFMERLDDAILIFDSSGKLADCNQKSLQLFPFLAQINTINEFYEQFNKIIVSGTAVNISGDTITEPEEKGLKTASGIRYYQHNITTVLDKNNRQAATVLTFHDITENTMLLRELEDKNTELDILNQELKNYITVAHRLEDEKEKTRVILEIQQTIGQNIAELLIGLEALKGLDNEQEEIVKAKLDTIIEKCRELMLEVRRSVENLIACPNKKE